MRCLVFADQGQNADGAIVTLPVAAALRGLVALVDGGQVPAREAALLLRERVGSPFGADAEARWRPVQELLPRVRAWLVGEVLEIVFEHLTPGDPKSRHMTAPRKEFWRDYTGSVVRLWVVVSHNIRPRLERPAVQRLREAMGEDFQVHELRGGPEQALVWMHCRGSRGLVTIVEGNANTSLRVKEGDVRPKDRTILYTHEVVDGEFSRDRAYVKSHVGNWEEDVRATLMNRFGLHAEPGRGRT